MVEIVHRPYVALLAGQAKAQMEAAMRRLLILAGALLALAGSPALAQTGQDAATNVSRPSPPPEIEPRNALEQAFLRALHEEDARPAFRRLFLTSYVALAIAERAPDAPPRIITLRSGRPTALIFTSGGRAAEVMGAQAPVLMLTGRQALQRVRDTNVVINVNLAPALTLEPEDIEAMLSMPDESPAPPTGSVEPVDPRLAGPTQ
ncbi:MAG: hypothetical protein K2P58_15280 [Hyphomonadaceae bacterium]|nr:hypothetical protein [Hyphomonadaceae bacterium]